MKERYEEVCERNIKKFVGKKKEKSLCKVQDDSKKRKGGT